jgi:DNA-binding transcriptional regulator PaaX
MSRVDTGKVVDGLLLGIALGTVTATMLAAPNAVQLLDKPTKKLFDELDERQRRREISRLKSYMKTRGLVRGDYDHGIELTKKALRRIKNVEYKNLSVVCNAKWDGTWRLVLFDIPEQKRANRVGFTRKLQELGFQILQQSIWIYPYEAKDEVYIVAKHHRVEEWVTYIITSHIDNDEKLKARFKHIIK